MKAAVLDRQGPITAQSLDLRNVPEPEPGPGELLIRVAACGICRTDLHVIEGDLPARKLPLIPGHQVVGQVERLGPDCRRFRVGDRVGIAWLRHTCSRCSFCRSGNENLCVNSRYTGYHTDGGYAELTVVDENFAYAIVPELTNVQAAPLLCAGIIGYRALRLSEVPPGGNLGLYGFGSSAHVVLQIALHRGCKVFVATRGARHRRLALNMGAAWAGTTADPLPEPVDGSIVFAPAGEIVPTALRSVRKGGVVALAGIYMTPVPELDYESCLFHEKTLRSVEANTRADGEDLLREAVAAAVRPRVTIFGLQEANDALIALSEDRLDGSGVLIV